MNRTTFQNLRAQMALRGQSIQTLAQAADMKYATLCRKMRGQSEFTFPEMLLLRRVLKFQGTLDALFCDEEDGQ